VTEKEKLSKDYKDNGWELCKKNIALAGYRITDAIRASVKE